jgi:hypothetical protein
MKFDNPAPPPDRPVEGSSASPSTASTASAKTTWHRRPVMRTSATTSAPTPHTASSIGFCHRQVAGSAPYDLDRARRAPVRRGNRHADSAVPLGKASSSKRSSSRDRVGSLSPGGRARARRELRAVRGRGGAGVRIDYEAGAGSVRPRAGDIDRRPVRRVSPPARRTARSATSLALRRGAGAVDAPTRRPTSRTR